MAETPLLSCSKTRGLPGLPPLPTAVADNPSDLYQVKSGSWLFVVVVVVVFLEGCRTWQNKHLKYHTNKFSNHNSCLVV